MTTAEGALEDAYGTSTSVALSRGRVVAVALATQALLLVLLALGDLGIHVPVLRPAVAFLYLTVFPGYFVVRLAGVDPDSPARLACYVVGASLTTLMALGTVLNFGLHAAGIARPLSVMTYALSGALVVLAVLYLLYGDDHVLELDVTLRELTSPWVLGLGVLPFAGIYGAVLLTRYSHNELLLALYLAIAAVPALVVAGKLPERLYPYALWIVSVSLLLQNTLTGRFLAWGDQPKEALLALSVMERGFWDPALAPAFGSKFAMLRIVILHPVHSLFTGLDLVWVFKIVHPLLFSVLPVVLFVTYRHYVDDDVAFLSSFLYVSLFSFFMVLSRNTRTAMAILFLALIGAVVADDQLDRVPRQGLAIAFTLSLIVSHYGVSYMMMMALFAVVPLAYVFGRFTREESRRITSGTYAGFYVTAIFAWYMYASASSKAYSLVVGFLRNFLSTITDQYLAEPESTSATARYVASDFQSIVIEILTFYNLAIGGVIAFGVGITVLKLFWSERDVRFDAEYLAFSVAFLALFLVTFLPVARFNTARTYATTLIFFVPFFVIGAREGLAIVGTVLERLPRDELLRVGATGVVLLYFLLNVGVISALVVDEYSPNVLVEKDRIPEDGHPSEQAYFFKMYPTPYGVESGEWIRTHAPANATVHSSGWPGNPKDAVGYESDDDPWGPDRPLEGRPIPANESLGPGYVYLNPYSDPEAGNVVRLPAGHFQYRWANTSSVSSKWADRNRIYTTNGTTIYG